MVRNEVFGIKNQNLIWIQDINNIFILGVMNLSDNNILASYLT